MSFLENIKNPVPEFSPAAFWFWYGKLDPQRLKKQINMMKEQGVYNAFMHARAYLETPYLGDEWWEAVSACIEEGKKIGFYTWLYDEYAWPSGTAGSTFDHSMQKPSLTLSKGECNMSKYLCTKRYDSFEDYCEDKYDKKTVAVFLKQNDTWVLVDENEKHKGETMAFFYEFSPRFVDYLNEDTISEFINYTHEEYKKRYKEHFGKNVPGIFFDEIFMIGKMPWTYRFPDEFKKRKGYDIVPKLYALGLDGGEEERKIRNDYYKVVSELYEEVFFQKISRWCQENNLEFTGHIEEFFVRHPGSQGQFFNNMRHLSIPGADCHDYRYRFPRKITYREPKFSVSVARAYGKKRMMSEAMGGAGWGCSLQQFKRGINTLGAMGINMFTLHGFYSECNCQGEQADWPSSFFFQNPYWRYFKHFADYINRICYTNTEGSHVVEIGIYYPIDEMQMETVAAAPTKNGIALDEAWNSAINSLVENQIDVDFIDEPCILNAKIENSRLNVGSQSFRVLVCPDIMKPSDCLNSKLMEFEKAGGKILYYTCDEACGENSVYPTELPGKVTSLFQPDVTVLKGEKDNLYVNHRRIEDKDFYFVSNGLPKTRTIEILLRETGGVQKLSPENGELSPVEYEITENGTKVNLFFEEDEAYWIVVDKDYTDKIKNKKSVIKELAVAGKWEFLPIDSDIADGRQLEIEKSEIEIPLAMFSSELHPFGRQIRIQNTKEELGFVARHLSLWKAKWITRRLDWIDASMKKELYFRKKFSLDCSPERAKICIVAVNEWRMWVNGEEATVECEDRTPTVVDVTKYLKAGENVIAIKVVNNTPMQHFNLLSVNNLPPEEMISLLAQLEITADGKNITIVTDESWDVNGKYFDSWEKEEYSYVRHNAYSSERESLGYEDDRWNQSWERGNLPLLPWGDIPLFGEMIKYPKKVCYTLTLPAGTSKVFYPELTGSDVCITVDGMKLEWENSECEIPVSVLTRQMQISMNVNSPEEGLHKSVKIEVLPFRSALCDWRLHGYKWYSGFARYRNRTDIKKQPGRYILSLGKTAFQAEVWINGKKAGERVWEPYRLDVTDYLVDGENEFVVIVANSAAVERQFMLVDEGMALGWDRYWNDDNIQREGENLLSGLQGPVSLTVVLDKIIENR